MTRSSSAVDVALLTLLNTSIVGGVQARDRDDAGGSTPVAPIAEIDACQARKPTP